MDVIVTGLCVVFFATLVSDALERIARALFRGL